MWSGAGCENLLEEGPGTGGEEKAEGRSGRGWGVACLLLFVGRQGLGQEFTPGCTLELPRVLFF